jgi:hypothetical protein
MLKCRHLRVRLRAPRATVMIRREMRRKHVALLPVCYLLRMLPLAVDPVHLLVEMKVLQGPKIKIIGRRRRRSSLPLHQRTLGRKIQGRNPRGEGGLDRQLDTQGLQSLLHCKF